MILCILLFVSITHHYAIIELLTMKLFQQNGGQILSILDDLIERGNMIIHMQDVIHVVEI